MIIIVNCQDCGKQLFRDQDYEPKVSGVQILVPPCECSAKQSTQNTHSLIKQAQDDLRSTGANWNEQCLFECDALLTEALGTQKDPIEREWQSSVQKEIDENLENLDICYSCGGLNKLHCKCNEI